MKYVHKCILNLRNLRKRASVFENDKGSRPELM